MIRYTGGQKIKCPLHQDKGDIMEYIKRVGDKTGFFTLSECKVPDSHC